MWIVWYGIVKLLILGKINFSWVFNCWVWVLGVVDFIIIFWVLLINCVIKFGLEV